MQNIKNSSLFKKLYSIPTAPLVLSVFSIIPFSICTFGVWFFKDPWQSFAFLNLLNYSVIVLSFLGAVQWGISLSIAQQKLSVQWKWYIWSIIPALLGWIVLMGSTNYLVVIFIFMLGFTLSYLIDSYSIRLGRAPEWYRTIRKTLTILVIIHFGAVMTYINKVSV